MCRRPERVEGWGLLHDYSVDPVAPVLEASCVTLLMLESFLADWAGGSDDDAHVRARTRRAIESLRAAVEELRLASLPDGIVPPGFVLAVPVLHGADDRPRVRSRWTG